MSEDHTKTETLTTHQTFVVDTTFGGDKPFKQMIDHAVEGMIKHAREVYADGWHISVVTPQRDMPDVHVTMILITTRDGKLDFGPVAFPAYWSESLHDLLGHVIEETKRKAVDEALAAHLKGRLS